MRILGGVLIVFGLLLSLSIVGAIVGVPLILVGIVLMVAGGRRRTVITNVVQVSTAPESRMSFEPSRSIRKMNEDLVPHFDEPTVSIQPRVSLPSNRQFSSSTDNRMSASRKFFDIENEITKRSMDILGEVNAAGFQVDYQVEENRILVTIPETGKFFLYSNEQILVFGKKHGCAT